ncbi:small acid-soluble spore protein Tlp [Rossellomorea marisflavi]|uniref:Small, acid-soluble spore protein Tlp n=1 Tax=Rossellomorea marisflavi TaxID=189381 RepID=A0A0J5SJQ8_9BACI|nr:small acid-soluble spore protein Tlp [Rossellomorea marisflavi]KMK97253.1 small acid-soluble spore protein Tlp [Rossellomorea marisflavi]KML06831.1 small acid-soluble spore protein Tlp [Rossellomorea marisflavi]KML35384.1 small acid-soluble spore protein Tlp [Rossellomorea marisflavi]KZE45282.1 small, acid-soluble spore protein Tlp [Rossellomorea marisflavi]MCM2603988.1 small acid-soluble spore protein Tlp [Rossellomorea marisflavi]
MNHRPDDRRDNAQKLQGMVQNTLENIDKAEESMAFTDSEEQLESIRQKNERRKESIEAFRQEIKDESHT